MEHDESAKKVMVASFCGDVFIATGTGRSRINRKMDAE